MNQVNETIVKLDNLKEELVSNHPYYNSLEHIHSFFDLPLMNKQRLSEWMPEFEKKLQQEHLSVNFTSGTTGIPFKCIKSRSEQVKLALNLYEYRKPFGLPRNHKMMLLSDRSLLFNRNPDMEQRLIASYILKLQSTKYDFVQARCSVLYRLARRILEDDIKLIFPPLFIQNWGELYQPTMKETIEQAFQAPFLDYYGMEEMWGIAFTNQEGQLEVDEKSVFVEVMDQDQRPVSNEETYGEIIVTSFIMRSVPYVRYRTGDIGRISRNTNTGKLLIEILPVRNNQIRLSESGEKASDSVFRFLDDLFKELYQTIGLKQFQIIQHTFIHFELLLVVQQQPDLSHIHSKVEPILKLCVAEDIELKITLTDYIAPNETSGKYQSFITKI